MTDIGHSNHLRLPKKWRFLLAASAVLVALTYVETNATTLVEGFPKLGHAIKKAIYGPDLIQSQLPNLPGGVSDGDTSDGSKAYKKTSDMCLRPVHNNGTLVPGSSQFVATRRSSNDRATVT